MVATIIIIDRIILLYYFILKFDYLKTMHVMLCIRLRSLPWSLSQASLPKAFPMNFL